MMLVRHWTSFSYPQFGVFLVHCILVRRRDMPRKGWSAHPTPSGWYSVIRGPRPPAEQWPRRQQQWQEWSYRGQWPTIPEVKRSQVQRRWQRGNIPRSVGRGTEKSGRRRFDRNSRTASSTEGSPPCGAGPPRGSANRRVRGVHSSITEAVRSVGGRAGEGTTGFGRRSCTNGQASRRGGTPSPSAACCFRFHTPGKIPDLVAELDRLRARVREMEVER